MPKPPNILLIVADELRADTLSAYGNPVCRTPNLDRMAAAGVRFADCAVTQPTCTPSRASILTGAFPSVLKTRMVGCHAPDDSRFLGHGLQRAGYRCASIGKIHLVPQRAEPDVLRAAMAREAGDGYYGFAEVDLVDGHGDGCFGPEYEAHAAAMGVDLDQARAQPRDGQHPLTPVLGPHRFRLPAELHSSHYLADRTIELLDSVRDDGRPLFAHVSFPDPHHPFTVPEPWASMYDPAEVPAPVPHGGQHMPSWYDSIFRGEALDVAEWEVRPQGPGIDRIIGTPPLDYSRVSEATWRAVRASYYGMTACLDHHVGRILDHLAATGMADSTVVVFVADHGEYLGDHGFVGKGLHFDSALRVPLLVQGPGILAGQTIEQPASTLDIAATLWDLAGVAEPEGVQGISFAPALRGTGPYRRTAALTENDDDMMPARLRTLTTTRWRLTAYAGGAEGELYDRIADPQETHNRYADPDYADTRRELKAMLFEEVLCACDYANARRQQPAPPPRHWVPSHHRPGE